MTFIEKIAYHQGIRSEVPNQELAALLVEEKSQTGVDEIASYLKDKNTSLQSDCIKVMYEVGYLNPQLITRHVDIFLKLLDSKKNRMVWGAMIALSTISELVPDKIWPHLEKIMHLIETGTVITNVSGVKTLINMARAGEPYYSDLIDTLLDLQMKCRNVDFTKRAEDMRSAIKPEHIERFRQILLDRKPVLSNAAQKRLERVIRKLG